MSKDATQDKRSFFVERNKQANTTGNSISLLSHFKQERVKNLRKFNFHPDWSDIFPMRESAMSVTKQAIQNESKEFRKENPLASPSTQMSAAGVPPASSS